MIDSKLQAEFDNAKRIVFLTGAGVSTASGIPDYRSKNGLYTNDKSDKPAEYYLSTDCLRDEPKVFWEYEKSNMYYPDAKPNVIHERQAEFTQKRNAVVVTQNIDSLYRKANTQHLVEFHGNLYKVYCQKCHKTVNYQDYLKSMYHENCGGILRPDIVLYGEGLDPVAISKSVEAVSQADLIVIVGTSMRVYPFAGLIDYRSQNAKVLAVNEEPLQFGFPFTMVKENAVDFFKDLTVNV
ncbi:NAD-dependent protein deacylase [Lentilactobacillus buchneri]|uniref:protein acetyllysine N-acetyltransferase n=1 Tax=Lentilactobacillus buchneri subsp. silagei CD034 TaxID=1071400 RepID=J9W6V8_LENBU|nr:NAD-dependent protein deacylase [Lentilactobacillus buchneri]MCC6101687.1 NAD-dependent protein deacylase [Lactobacillus sp.]AFS00680.1 NAD-dependent deacetylase [Lentilactobacillus buchneri subsp. silagei CD034]MCT2901565.1 NAD-dependent protein deacylase [Lentilactobacillus buchneri]MCT3542833.1 NAD-dependent protein deacylase [Lentilactobacillus buchneri]MCT3545260.1 NAD-dependent protein deacylase [Lentilactobacillus buchneri]